MRCPDCGKAMIGTRAHGRTRVYRYYTCFTRARYDSGHCNASRLDADAIEDAVLAALVGFYRDQHDLIADAITAAQANHAAGQHYRRAELAATERDLARTGAAIDRYLVAFENGTLDPEDLAGRLAKLRARSGQLRARQDELAGQVASVLAASPAATLLQVADHIVRILQAGSHSQRKAMIEALIARIKITGPGRIVPFFRIPQPQATDLPQVQAGPAATHCRTAVDAVRVMTNLVGRTHHDANHDLVVAGDPLAVGLRWSRAGKAAGARSGGGAGALKALGDPDLDDGLPGDAEAPRFPVQGLDHP
jgi:site-specific DNA recombinase